MEKQVQNTGFDGRPSQHIDGISPIWVKIYLLLWLTSLVQSSLKEEDTL